MEWLTTATSPWWAAPVTSLVTLWVGARIGRKSAEQQADKAKVESDAARRHAEALADKQHAADRQARLDAAEGELASQRNASRADAFEQAIRAIAALRSAVTANDMQATLKRVYPLAVAVDLVTEVQLALGRLSLLEPEIDLGNERALADIMAYARVSETNDEQVRMYELPNYTRYLDDLASRVSALYRRDFARPALTSTPDEV